jgi:Protein of unknown function (DUF3417)
LERGSPFGFRCLELNKLQGKRNIIADLKLLNLSERIVGLEKLAYNLWWSWHPEAWKLFATREYRPRQSEPLDPAAGHRH